MVACLCIHGFTGSPREVEPLANFLEQHTNWECVIPTLPGHGENLQLQGIHFNEWIEHAEYELKRLLQREKTVYVIGFSMGGLIASYLAIHYPVKKLILLSASAYFGNPSKMWGEIKYMANDFWKGNLKNNELFSRYRRKMKSTPITATVQFRKLVHYIRPFLSKVHVPTFIAQGENDGLVPIKSAKYLYNTIRAKEKRLLYIKESDHLICHCNEKEKLFTEILSFLK
ncbi:alpha/beta hydrolase [Niallia sp. 01092]|uniref:alpha/beta hydrolase n=1 Tax=unclassified Niallia TaxID=2837522 RepID=UPI003FD17696